jgi:hypothetical protein
VAANVDAGMIPGQLSYFYSLACYHVLSKKSGKEVALLTHVVNVEYIRT